MPRTSERCLLSAPMSQVVLLAQPVKKVAKAKMAKESNFFMVISFKGLASSGQGCRSCKAAVHQELALRLVVDVRNRSASAIRWRLSPAQSGTRGLGG